MACVCVCVCGWTIILRVLSLSGPGPCGHFYVHWARAEGRSWGREGSGGERSSARGVIMRGIKWPMIMVFGREKEV